MDGVSQDDSSISKGWGGGERRRLLTHDVLGGLGIGWLGTADTCPGGRVGDGDEAGVRQG